MSPSALRAAARLGDALRLLTPLLSIVRALSPPQRLGLLVCAERIAGPMLRLAMTAVWLRKLEEKGPVRRAADAALAAVPLLLGSAFWSASRRCPKARICIRTRPPPSA